jgi:hypothetical protein
MSSARVGDLVWHPARAKCGRRGCSMEWEGEGREHPFEVVGGARGAEDRVQVEVEKTLHPLQKIRGGLAQRYTLVGACVV